jgi:hypothetical protein
LTRRKNTKEEGRILTTEKHGRKRKSYTKGRSKEEF